MVSYPNPFLPPISLLCSFRYLPCLPGPGGQRWPQPQGDSLDYSNRIPCPLLLTTWGMDDSTNLLGRFLGILKKCKHMRRWHRSGQPSWGLGEADTGRQASALAGSPLLWLSPCKNHPGTAGLWLPFSEKMSPVWVSDILVESPVICPKSTHVTQTASAEMKNSPGKNILSLKSKQFGIHRDVLLSAPVTHH